MRVVRAMGACHIGARGSDGRATILFMELCIVFILGVVIGIAIRQRIYWLLRRWFNVELPTL